ncbi:MAG: glycosyltransferase family 39 protein [Anaerolineaceae bacterium]|nr:glycosyltransferase family 39 protein [Anaerolineaceae bacterium]
MTSTVERRILYAILALYAILGVTYSIVSPIFEVSDELWHYPMVKYLADNGLQLPPQDPANPGLWRQEGSQPPLYYLMSAVLTAGIDTSNLETVRRQNPHSDIGVIRPDGNANMMVHRQEMEAFPWYGTAMAVHVVRLFSVALGVGTVWVTYQIGREVFPDWPSVALGAAGLTAFLPMFLFISGSVNNDNLSNLLGNLLTLLIVRLLKGKTAPSWRSYTLLGTVTGMGLLAKLNIGFLIPLVGLALLVVSVRLRDWRPLVAGGLISGALTVAIAGWWYWHNWQIYGDPTGLDMFLQMVGRRAIPANAAQLWSERHSFTQAYWGFFGGVNVAMPDTVYLIFNIIGGLGLLGGLAFIINVLVRRRWSLERWLPILVTILWPLVTFVSYLRWTAETPASQGRLVFGAVSSISLWMAVGLIWRWPKKVQPYVLSLAVGFFMLVASLSPFRVIAPAYALPETLPAGEPTALFAEVDGGIVGLFDARVVTGTAQPEAYVLVELDWQIVQPLNRDWSLFIHLVTPDNVIVGQRDIYPGGGKLATSDLPRDYAWRNPVAVWVPPAAYAPMMLTVEVGWYHLPTGERLTLSDGSERLAVGTVELQARKSNLGIPNPVSINFDNQLELVGYALSDLSPQVGDTVDLTLYWRGLEKMDRDYIVFAHIIDPSTLTIYAGSDAMPVQWNAPTSTWTPGEIITDNHVLTVREEAIPGIYELEIGLYTQEPDGAFPRLRIVTPDGGMANDFTYLSRVRVLMAD